jgi:hypothetical protein
LEALFLHIGPNNPELPLRIHAFRGIEQVAVDAEEMWGWLFSGKRTEETIELSSLSEGNGHRSLRIRLAEPETPRLLTPSNSNNVPPRIVGALTTAVGPRELVLEYQDANGQTGLSRILVTTKGVEVKHAPLAPLPVGVFLSSRARFPGEDAVRFSNLERVGRQDEVLNALRLLEPHLRRLAVLVTGGVPMINGDIGIKELVPLPLMGEGLVRLLSTLLAIANAPHGTVLVDEIENGLHHSIMVNVWKEIADAARRSETQIFATTHSWECIWAAHEAFTASGTYDFRLHRLDRVNGEIRAVTYDQEMLATAIATDLEVR